MAFPDPAALSSVLSTAMTPMQGVSRPLGAISEGDGSKVSVDFGAVLKHSLDKVNAMQAQSTQLAAAFEAGNGSVDLHDAMLAMQKAGIAFQTTIQVRNKMVSAYNDIMNMSI